MWDKKSHKVRHEKLIQNYENAGLKLVDLQSKDIALKAACVCRINDQDISHPITN